MSSYSGSGDVFVGGITGRCIDCTLESTVYMASVSFTGSISNNLYFGGIVGILVTSSYETTVRNCANYGSVTHSGTVNYAFIGGIVGKTEGSSSKFTSRTVSTMD